MSLARSQDVALPGYGVMNAVSQSRESWGSLALDGATASVQTSGGCTRWPGGWASSAGTSGGSSAPVTKSSSSW